MERKLIGVKELARYLDINEDTVYDWTFQKKIPYYKIGRLVKFDLQEIDKWMKERRVKEVLIRNDEGNLNG